MTTSSQIDSIMPSEQSEKRKRRVEQFRYKWGNQLIAFSILNACDSSFCDIRLVSHLSIHRYELSRC